jgi:VRR-NUC domain-containing protein
VSVITADEYRQLNDRKLSEAAWQAEQVKFAREHGWLVHYLPDWMYRSAMADMRKRRRGDRDWADPGFPDVWCLHPASGRLVVFENKSEAGSVRPEQKIWIAGLVEAGVDVRVARPRDRETIEALLQGDGQ